MARPDVAMVTIAKPGMYLRLDDSRSRHLSENPPHPNTIEGLNPFERVVCLLITIATYPGH